MENRKSIKEVLMQRDGLSSKQADDLINEAQNEFYRRLESGDMFDIDSEICGDFFGLEADYIDEFLF